MGPNGDHTRDVGGPNFKWFDKPLRGECGAGQRCHVPRKKLGFGEDGPFNALELKRSKLRKIVKVFKRLGVGSVPRLGMARGPYQDVGGDRSGIV